MGSPESDRGGEKRSAQVGLDEVEQRRRPFRQRLAEAVEGNPLASPLAVVKLAKVQKADFGTDFALEWELEDLELALASVGAEHAPIAAAIADRWQTLVAEGLGGLDVSAAALGLKGAIYP